MFFKDLGDSLKAYFTGISFLTKHDLWKLMIIPGVISVLYSILVIWLAATFDDKIVEWATGWIGWAWLKNIIAWIISATFYVFAYFFGMLTYRFIVLIILSPFLAKISERVEFALTGKGAPEVGFKGFVQDILRAIGLGIRNLLLELLFTLLLWFVPLLGTPAIYLVQSCYGGFGVIDVTLERKRFSIGQSAAFMRKHRGMCIGLGIGFQLLALIPIVGWFLAPTLGTVAGTLRVLDIEKRETKLDVKMG